VAGDVLGLNIIMCLTDLSTGVERASFSRSSPLCACRAYAYQTVGVVIRGPPRACSRRGVPNPRTTEGTAMSDTRQQRSFSTVEQLAKRWNVSTRTIRRLIESDKLRAVRVGNQLRIADDAVERFERRNETAR
jgi:excisionase family DNA binding protein